MEGDFEFMTDILLLFKRLINSSEIGKFISFKMRRFYKNFELPKTLSPKGTQEFVDYLKTLNQSKVSVYFNSQDIERSKPVYNTSLTRLLKDMELNDRL